MSWRQPDWSGRSKIETDFGWLNRVGLLWIEEQKEYGWDRTWLLYRMLDDGQVETVPYMKQAFLEATTGSNVTYTSDATWNNASNTVEVVGAGGAGAHGASTTTGGGGGAGGGYNKISNFSFATPGTTTAVYRVGTAGVHGGTFPQTGGDSWFNATAFPTTGTAVGAKGGPSPATNTTATGGVAVATTSFYPTTSPPARAGGNGAAGTSASAGGGAGGAGGPTGAGGAASTTTGGTADGGTVVGGPPGNGATAAGKKGTEFTGSVAGGIGSGGGGSNVSAGTGGTAIGYGGGGGGGSRSTGTGGDGFKGIVVLSWVFAGTHAVSVTSGQSATAIKSANKNVSASSMSLVNSLTGFIKTAPLMVSMGSVVSLALTPLHPKTLTAVIANYVSGIALQITAGSQAGTGLHSVVTKQSLLGKLAVMTHTRFVNGNALATIVKINHGKGKGQNVSKKNTLSKSVAVATGSVTSALRVTARAIALGIASIVSLVPVKSGGTVTNNATILVSNASSIVLTYAANRLLTITTAASQSLATVKSVLKTIAASFAQTVTRSSIRAALRTVSVASGEVFTLSQVRSYLRAISIASGEAAIAIRSSLKRMLVSSAQAVTLSALRSYLRTLSFAIGEAVTLSSIRSYLRTLSVAAGQAVTRTSIKSYLRTLSIASAQLVALGRTGAKLLSITSGRLITLSALRSYIRTLTIASGELVALSKIAAHLRTLTIVIGEAITLSSIRAYLRSLSMTTGESVALSTVKAALRSITVSMAELVTRTGVGAKTVSQQITSGQTTSLLRSVGHVILTTIAEQVSLSTLNAHMKTIVALSAQLLTASRSAAKAVKVSTAQTMTAVASKAFLRALSAVNGLFVSGTAAATISNTIHGKGTHGSITLMKAVAHAVSVLAAQLVSAVRSIDHAVTASWGELVTTARVKTRLLTETIASAEKLTSATAKQARRTLSVSASGATTLIRKVGHATSMQVAPLVLLQNSARHVVAVAWGETVTLTRIKTRLLTETIAQSEALTLARGVARLISLIVGQAVSAAKVPGKILTTAGAASTVALLKATGKTIRASVGETVSLVASITSRSTNKTVNIASGQAVAIYKTLAQLSAISIGQAVTLVQTIGKALALAAGSAAFLAMTMPKTVSLYSASSVATVRMIGKNLKVALGAGLSVVAAFIQGFFEPIGERIHLLGIFDVLRRLIGIQQTETTLQANLYEMFDLQGIQATDVKLDGNAEEKITILAATLSD